MFDLQIVEVMVVPKSKETTKVRHIKTFEAFLVTEKPYSKDEIVVFDLDDTLVITDAKIKVCDHFTGKCFSLTPEEFNEFEAKKQHELDFTDFADIEIMKAGKLIEYYLDIFKRNYKRGIAVGIVTARDDREMIYTWLREHVGFRIDKDLIFAISDNVHGFKGNIADRKKQAFETYINMGYTNFKFYDDDIANLKLVKSLEKEHDNIKIYTKKAKKPKY